MKEAVEKAESAADRAEAAASTLDEKISDEDGLLYTKVLTAAALPSIGKEKRLYIDQSTSKMWIWDNSALRYTQVGGGEGSATEWDIIDGGNAFSV